MRLLADENLDAIIVEWLRKEGHDVVWIAESNPGLQDIEIVSSAKSSERILITRDKDFGTLSIYEGFPISGVVLLRIRARTQQIRLDALRRLWPEIEQFAKYHFLTISNNRVRSRRLDERWFI